MQVKKFEARTMKEALELVKTQLGPDAIILSVRDNNKSFGLVGEGSVEITAAVSEETLMKKKFTESRLKEQDKEKFQRTPARQQKEIIEKMVQHHIQKESKPAITQRRYIEIADEAEAHLQNQIAEERIRNATLKARHGLGGYDTGTKRQSPPVDTQAIRERVTVSANAAARTQKMSNPAVAVAAPVAPAPTMPSTEITALKNEIESLKQVIAHFQQMPQNFAGAHPGASYGLPYELSYMFEKLTQAGVAEEIVGEILEKATQAIPIAKLKNRSLVDGWVARQIMETTLIADNNLNAKIHCFMGPSGGGKTSIMVKMASHMVIREGKKVAMLTTDTYKVGAADQLKIYAQILNVPFAVIRNQNDWVAISKYLKNIDVVLVDCPGLALRNSEEINFLKSVMPQMEVSIKTHLVLPATIKDQDAVEAGRKYAAFNYTDVIFTGLDESSQHGVLYNFTRRFDIPLHSFGIGPRIPEDFEFATKERVLDLLFRITHKPQQQSVQEKAI
ncbi:MAG: flagellar biosynthesis protein FlhF [Bdellovibrionia bacterium]